MRVRKLTVRNFRGIRTFNWDIDARFICLVGPGDSTKTTILDALGLVLSRRYNVSFTDADFYDCNTDEAIEIVVTITGLPDALVEERSHGKNRSGIRSTGELVNDPLDDDDVEECLIVRLRVDADLEPIWEVIRPNDDAGEYISATDRAKLGFFRVGTFADLHLKWSRSSALSSLTSSKTEAAHAVVEAHRQARQAIMGLSDTPLHEASSLIQASSLKLGTSAFTNLKPGLDPSVATSTATLVLHEGNVPLTSYGLGSRRLTSLAIQESAITGESILAVDELEHGLDPHRLIHLLRYLRAKASEDLMQVFITTHSPLVVSGLDSNEMQVIRSDEGTTTATPVPTALRSDVRDTTQGLMRARPSALLAKRVVVGEGATETGMVRYSLEAWDDERADPLMLTAVTNGCVATNGGGDSQAPHRAKALAALGYPTFLLVDGDVSTNIEAINSAKAAGVEVLRWPDGMALEDVIVVALDWADLQAFIELAAEEASEESVCASVGSHLGVGPLPDLDVSRWRNLHGDEAVRGAIAKASKGKNVAGDSKSDGKAWFKREDRGERLAQLLFAARGRLDPDCVLVKGLQRLKAFATPAVVSEAVGSDDTA
jgi:putative ATP-dependent endonuclease of the OLD family